MRSPFSLLLLFLSVIPQAISAQNVSTTQPPKPASDGVYEVAISDLQRLDSSPKLAFPRELSAYELTDKVVIALTISPEGKVKKVNALSGKIDALKQAAAKTAKNWVFQPYLVSGTPVPVRTEITFNFNNTLDGYRDPNGDIPVHLDEKASHPLIVKSVPPQYPPDARASHIQGSVKLRAIIGEDGRLHALHIIQGHPMLAAAAYNAVRQWLFKPYVENGKPLPVDTNVTVNFTLAGF
jgi:TonB family protein